MHQRNTIFIIIIIIIVYVTNGAATTAVVCPTLSVLNNASNIILQTGKELVVSCDAGYIITDFYYRCAYFIIHITTIIWNKER